MQCPHCKKDLPASILALFPKPATVEAIRNLIGDLMVNDNLQFQIVGGHPQDVLAYLAHALAGFIPAPEKMCPVCKTGTVEHTAVGDIHHSGTGHIPPTAKLVANSSSVVVNPDVASEFPAEKAEVETCTFCGGIGRVPNHPHIEANICDMCEGSGRKIRNDYKLYNQARSECIAVAQKLMAEINSELEACRDANTQKKKEIACYREALEEVSKKVDKEIRIDKFRHIGKRGLIVELKSLLCKIKDIATAALKGENK